MCMGWGGTTSRFSLLSLHPTSLRTEDFLEGQWMFGSLQHGYSFIIVSQSAASQHNGGPAAIMLSRLLASNGDYARGLLCVIID